MATLQLQPANTLDGSYDVNLPLPYPYLVDGSDAQCGDRTYRLVGYQRGPEPDPTGVMFPEDITDPTDIVGLFLVLGDGSTMFNLTTPIESVTVSPE